MFNVEELYREDIGGARKIISVGGGRELRGPCPDPACGGDDRFGLYPRQNNGEGSYYCGRGALAGNGCGKGGDIIQYLRDFRNMSYLEACRFLGKEPKGGGGKHFRLLSPSVPKRPKGSEKFVAETKRRPEEVVDEQKWHEHGMKFVNACHEALLKRTTSIVYLNARGISLDAIKKYKLGFHSGEVRNGKEYEPSFRPWPSWGLRNEKKGGRSRMLVLPAGLVIPQIVSGHLHCITIRRVKPKPSEPKYHYVIGSIRSTWLSNPDAKVFVVQEAMLDCIAVDDAAGDIVGTVGLGTTGTKPDVKAATSLKEAQCILGALDYDAPRLNPRTNKMERPGQRASIWWQKNYPQYRRFPVPKGKDAGEAFAEGVDLRIWAICGMPQYLRPDLLRSDLSDKPKVEIVENSVGQECENEGDAPVTESSGNDYQQLVEFRALLAESGGYMRIYDLGSGVGLDVDQDWTEENREKRTRMSQLLFGSDAVGNLIDNLADGVYDAENIRV